MHIVRHVNQKDSHSNRNIYWSLQGKVNEGETEKEIELAVVITLRNGWG